MKRSLIAGIVMTLIIQTVIWAEEKAERKETQWIAEIGCGHCDYEKETGAKTCCAAAKTRDNVYLPIGKEVTDCFKQRGIWVINGTLSQSNRSSSRQSFFDMLCFLEKVSAPVVNLRNF